MNFLIRSWRNVLAKYCRFCPVAALLLIAVFSLVSCIKVGVNIGQRDREPLKEFVLEGKGRGKVLVIPVKGFLSDSPKKGLLGSRPSTVQEFVSQLRKAEKDEAIKTVLLEIDSPGGSVTAADILYHEIVKFKEKARVKIVAMLLDVAASGGYYIALPADVIFAHPTTITGSVGVVFIAPKVVGLMDKVGVAVEVNKSGKEKDMGSPFRFSTTEEREILQGLTNNLADRFLHLLDTHRKIEPGTRTQIASGRIYLAASALQFKLVDRIGYASDALNAAKRLGGLPEDAKIVVYRRTEYANDNIYNTSALSNENPALSLTELDLSQIAHSLGPGFFYLWLPGSKD